MVVDIGVNLTNAAFRKHWREVVQRSIAAGADTLILTGTSIKTSRQCQNMAQAWFQETGIRNLYFTVGVHPHDAKSFYSDSSLQAMRELLAHPLAVAVGECGLDFNRDYSPRPVQLQVFLQQVKLACELQKPLFVHEREAHEALVGVLDELQQDVSVPPLPPIVIHCFTGTETQALEYIRRGFCIGFTGTICKKERGAPLREILPKLPLDRLMVETDAPFMGFKKKRRGSEPADVVDVARRLADVVGVPHETVFDVTTRTASAFFRLDDENNSSRQDSKDNHQTSRDADEHALNHLDDNEWPSL